MGNVLCRLAKYEDIVANFFTCPVKELFYATCHNWCVHKLFYSCRGGWLPTISSLLLAMVRVSTNHGGGDTNRVGGDEQDKDRLGKQHRAAVTQRLLQIPTGKTTA